MITVRYLPELRHQACLLRHQGDSVRVIADTLGVPRATVGGWVRGIAVETAMVRYCQHCGGAFLASRSDQKWCCKAHSRGGVVYDPVRSCLFCAQEFEVTRVNKFYCCGSHRAAGYRAGIRIPKDPKLALVEPLRPVWDRIAA